MRVLLPSVVLVAERGGEAGAMSTFRFASLSFTARSKRRMHRRDPCDEGLRMPGGPCGRLLSIADLENTVGDFAGDEDLLDGAVVDPGDVSHFLE